MENKTERIIDGIHIETEKSECISANIIGVEAGTTGYCGGDSGHGGRTYFRLSDLASTEMRLSFTSQHSYNNGVVEIDGKQYQVGSISCSNLEASDIQIVFGGDCELDTFIEALEFTLNTLKKKVKKN